MYQKNVAVTLSSGVQANDLRSQGDRTLNGINLFVIHCGLNEAFKFQISDFKRSGYLLAVGRLALVRWLRAEGVRQTLTRFLLHLSLHRLHRTTLRLHYTEASAMDSVKLTTEGVITTSIVSALTTHLLVQFKEPYLIHVVLLAFAFPPLLTAFFVSAGKPLASAAGYTTLALSIYASLLTTSILLYRVFFHRTAGLKGPKLAPLSKLWYGIVSAGGHIDLRVRELHHQYSDIVRTGPNDLSICHGALNPLFRLILVYPTITV